MKHVTENSTDEGQGNWYVLTTKHAQEWRALEHLRNQRVNCWLPTFTSQVSDGRLLSKGREELLFPRYIFVQFDPEVIHTTTIKATRGVAGIVSFNNTPAVMDVTTLNALRERVEGGGQQKVPDSPPVHGDTVTILNGSLDGLEAIWHQPDGDKRAMLLINLFGRITEARIRSEMRFRRSVKKET